MWRQLYLSWRRICVFLLWSVCYKIFKTVGRPGFLILGDFNLLLAGWDNWFFWEQQAAFNVFTSFLINQSSDIHTRAMYQEAFRCSCKQTDSWQFSMRKPNKNRENRKSETVHTYKHLVLYFANQESYSQLLVLKWVVQNKIAHVIAQVNETF
jgi:hypothetical protein